MEIKRDHVLNLQIESDGDIGFCRRKTTSIAKNIGFDEVKTGEIAIIVTELVTNVLKHGGAQGKIVVCEIQGKNLKKGIEIWCCDKGKGISNFKEALSDGFTEKGTLGIGLGSILRFSDDLEINPPDLPGISDSYLSITKSYTNCIRSVKWIPQKHWHGKNRDIITGAASRCKPGERLNGDEFIINHISTNQTIVSVIDGLGHGKDANLASQIIKEQILLKPTFKITHLLENIHNAARGTRGAVIGIAAIDTSTNKLFFSGIGNIESFILHGNEKKNLISYGGILGHKIRTPRIFESDFFPGDLLFLHSDGITSRWDYKNLDLKKHPQQNAEYILNNFSRDNDDATILIISRNK